MPKNAIPRSWSLIAGADGRRRSDFPAATRFLDFPLAAHSSGRYLVRPDGTPFPILGRASWYVLTLGVAAYQAYIDDTVAKGYTAIEIKALLHDSRAPGVPAANGGTLLPFTKRLDGAAWSGSLTYAVAANEAPDFAQPNEPYWAYVDALLAHCAARGILVLMFPAYVGFQGGAQGWMVEMVANGQTKCQTFGTWIATRYAAQPNIVWMLGGDFGTAPNTFSAPQSNAEQGLVTGLTSVVGQSALYSAEWDSESISTDQATFANTINLNGAYSFAGAVSTFAGNAYAYATRTLPAYLLEEPYDEEGPDGTNVNAAATQPVRRFQWWGWLRSIGGYMSGNGFVWTFASGYATHLNTAGAQDMARLNAFVQSIAWQRLVPGGLGGIGTLITAGGGTIDTTSYAAAAATPLGDLLVAYLGPGTAGSVTIDMTKLRGTVTCRWFDPTNGSYTAIGSFANTGTRAFTTPGANSAGAADWVLRLDA